MGRITRSAAVTKVTLPPADQPDGTLTIDTRADLLSVEEPLELRVNGTTFTTTMRTPGDDTEWAHGFLLGEGVIHQAEDVASARYCAGATGPHGENTYNVLNVELAAHVPPPSAQSIRLTPTTSACGVCGSSSIEKIMGSCPAPLPAHPLDPDVVVRVPEILREHQKSFRKTGGIHAAGAFTLEGQPIVVREDIGRHNAADKVIGHLLLNNRLPAEDLLLVMSSRASFELAQKAIAARFSALLAVSAATSLAVDLAREANLGLVGFIRGRRFNLYSGRINN